jgi:hypothetical protein
VIGPRASNKTTVNNAFRCLEPLTQGNNFDNSPRSCFFDILGEFYTQATGNALGSLPVACVCI